MRGFRITSHYDNFTLTPISPPANEVAYAVGFNDLSYFTRAFKRQLGVCPGDYQADAR